MRCPNCQSRSIVKNGTRKLRFETIQTYQCKKCNKRFQQRNIPHKTYKPQVLYTSLVLYYQGNSLDAVRRQVNKRFKIRVGVSTIFSWIKEYRYLCPIHQIRHQFYQNNSIIFRKRFDHENLKYEYLYHKYKLSTQVKPRFPGLFPEGTVA